MSTVNQNLQKSAILEKSESYLKYIFRLELLQCSEYGPTYKVKEKSQKKV